VVVDPDDWQARRARNGYAVCSHGRIRPRRAPDRKVMHCAEELKYKLHEMKALAAKAREDGSPVVCALKFRALCEASVALVLAHDRAVIPALRTLAWKDVRSDALVAYATFKQCVAALLPLQADDPQTGA